MRLSTRGRYGVRAMLELALNGQNGPISLKAISERQQISLDYLEQLLRRLRKAGLVRSIRGPRGGFVLARAPADLSLWDIVVALEHEVAPVHCVDDIVLDRPLRKGHCRKMKECAAHQLWADMARLVRGFLQSHSLQQLADSSRRLGGSGGACDLPLVFEI